MEVYQAAWIVVLSLLAVVNKGTDAWGSEGGDKVMLKDMSVITLYHGRMTNARRTSPIPQMKCTGGTASCSFTPQVVQCYNRGHDGYDVQWECKTDMDNAYRFGQVEVSCEGYDYPEDPYILKGSCGLEYTLDLTKEGHAQKQGQGHHSYYGDDAGYQQGGNSYYTKAASKKTSWMGDLLTLAVIGIIIYAIYKTCLSSHGHPGDEDGDDGYRRGNRTPRGGPPPPGFRDEYMPGSGGGGCSSTYDSTYTSAPRHTPGGMGNAAGGFWGGAATGGILGYLMGSRTNTQYGYQRPYGGSTWGTGWGGSSWGGSGSTWGSGGGWGRSTGGGGFGGSSGSTGTRTASGFGGTRRR